MTKSSNIDDLAADILRGAEQIAAFIGVDPRRCFYLLESGHLPCGKEGNLWVASRTRLRAFYTSPQHTPKESEAETERGDRARKRVRRHAEQKRERRRG